MISEFTYLNSLWIIFPLLSLYKLFSLFHAIMKFAKIDNGSINNSSG
jgi:hypothetical protein